jgi:hypothetical protein
MTRRHLVFLPLALTVTLAVAARSNSAVVTREQVEISAPILPNVLKLYTTFPSTLEGEKAMAHDAALTYDALLTECAPDYPAITLPQGAVTTLTPEQIAANYNSVADCSYKKHTAKPYWIPKLVDDVDICGTELGAGWRLITEDDLASLTDADFQFLQDTLIPLSQTAGSTGLGTMYFNLHVWVRARDGKLAQGNLSPGDDPNRVTELPFDPASGAYTQHYEGSLGLRCIRRTDLP